MEASRVKSEHGQLQQRASALQENLDELRDAAQGTEDSVAARAASDAMLRRLENERQYLKSQLTSEVTCKGELQAALDAVTRRLAERQANWKEQSDALTASLHAKTDEAGALEVQLRQAKNEAHAMQKQLEMQRDGLRGAYEKTREQLRLEQASLSTANAAAE